MSQRLYKCRHADLDWRWEQGPLRMRSDEMRKRSVETSSRIEKEKTEMDQPGC